MLSRLHHWPRTAWARLPALLPSSCVLCGCSGADALCPDCRASFCVQRSAGCACCGIALGEDASRCGNCLRKPPAFDATIVAVDYAPPIDQLVLALKFGARLELAPLFASMLRDSVLARRDSSLPGLLIPVPLGPRRLVERGFNQALEMAKPLAQALGARVAARAVIRVRDTQAQTLLHPDERQRNLSDAFLVAPNAVDAVRGAHIGVVDDVMTTGETLNALAAALKRFGAARVTNIVFARTMPR